MLDSLGVAVASAIGYAVRLMLVSLRSHGHQWQIQGANKLLKTACHHAVCRKRKAMTGFLLTDYMSVANGCPPGPAVNPAAVCSFIGLDDSTRCTITTV